MENRDSINYLFVYGSLMRGFSNALHLDLDERASFIGEGSVAGLLYDVGPYPAFILPDQHPNLPQPMRVHGELYHIESPDLVLETIDTIEGYNERFPERSLYKREPIHVDLENGSQRAYIYVYQQKLEGLHLVESGNYRLHKEHKPS